MDTLQRHNLTDTRYGFLFVMLSITDGVLVIIPTTRYHNQVKFDFGLKEVLSVEDNKSGNSLLCMQS
jgi:hypothetical protein